MRSYRLTFDGGANWCCVFEDGRVEGDVSCIIEHDAQGRMVVRPAEDPAAEPVVIDWEYLGQLEDARTLEEVKAVIAAKHPDSPYVGALANVVTAMAD